MIEKEKRKYLFEVKKRHQKKASSGTQELEKQPGSHDSFLEGLMSMMCFAGGTVDTIEGREEPGTTRNGAGNEESAFERTMDCIAFPEQHLNCVADPGVDNGLDIAQSHRSSTMNHSAARVQAQQVSLTPQMACCLSLGILTPCAKECDDSKARRNFVRQVHGCCRFSRTTRQLWVAFADFAATKVWL